MIKHLVMRYIVTIGIIGLMVCSLFPRTGFAAKVSTTPDILGSTGKTKLESAYTKYFDDDKDGKGGALFHYMANGSAYIASDYDNDVGNGYRAVKSEGQSYGMMITLQMNDEYKFQRLWDFARQYMRHTDSSNSLYGLHKWQVKTNGSNVQTMSENVASDGEIWFAAALYMASSRWGDKAWPYDYSAQAQSLLDAMVGEGTYANVSKESRIFIKRSSDSRYGMVRFGPYMNYSDPSYHVPAFFELFSKSARSTQQYFWSDVATKSRVYLAQTTFKSTLSNGTVVTNSSTGLFPDQAGFNGVSDSNNSQTVTDRNFSYDAWRTASHIAMDYTLWGAADNAYRADELTVINKYLTFMKNQNYARIAHEYTLSGTAVITGQPVGLLAATTGAAIATSNSTFISGFSSAFNSAYIPDDYYGACLYMLNSLMANGKFSMYVPGD